MPFGTYLAEVAAELARLARDEEYRERMRQTRSRRYWVAVAGFGVVLALVGLLMLTAVVAAFVQR